MLVMLPRAPTSLFVRLRDFSCSVKSVAAPMARPSRAVIQTFMLLGLKSCPEFVLAGRSSRSHRDYLFIFEHSEHGGLLSDGDPTATALLICASVLQAQIRGKMCAYSTRALHYWKFRSEVQNSFKIHDMVRHSFWGTERWKVLQN